jgi:REP element-mobilizing transposase RayT
VANSKHTPAGNANLLIGAVKDAVHETGRVTDSIFETRGKKDAIRENGAPRWHSRGYLPHFECADVTQHVTFHLADALPQTVLLRLQSELKSLPTEKRDIEHRKRIDAWIDAGHGSCVLRKPAIANMVQESLLTFDSQRYHLLAWVVMPNHVHALFEPMNGWTVAKIVASWKKFTARKICDHQRALGEAPSDPIWHREYWDRFIRDQTHLIQAIDYIHKNPVKAGLASTPESWPWSSAFPGNANLPIGAVNSPTNPAIHENGAPSKNP